MRHRLVVKRWLAIVLIATVGWVSQYPKNDMVRANNTNQNVSKQKTGLSLGGRSQGEGG